MLELNKVMIVGRLTRDPETRMLPSGSSVANFGVAVSRRYRDPKTNEWVDDTCFIDVKAWNKQAEFVQQYFTKGKGIFVEGRLVQESWETDGQKRSKVLIVAEQMKFAESKIEEEARLARSGGASSYGGAPSSGQQRPSYGGGGGGGRRPEYAEDGGGAGHMPPMPGGDSGGTDDDLPF